MRSPCGVPAPGIRLTPGRIDCRFKILPRHQVELIGIPLPGEPVIARGAGLARGNPLHSSLMRRRWIGIRASAVLAILGSLATLLMAGMMAWSMFHAKLPRDVAMPPVTLKVFGVAMGVLFAGLGVWGIWTAVAIFRRRGWARISILVFAALLAFMGASALLAILVMPFPSPPGVSVSARAMENVRWAIAASYGALALIGAWWLVLFNTRATKQYFAEREPARESARPLSIVVIGWYLLVCAAGTALAAVLRVPTMLFGLIVTGWSAVALCTALVAIDIYLGAGLLRLRERARLWSIVYFCAVAANSVVSLARPGIMQQMQRAAPRFFPTAAAMPQMGNMWVFGLISAAAFAVPIWFLVRRRAAFPQA